MFFTIDDLELSLQVMKQYNIEESIITELLFHINTKVEQGVCEYLVISSHVNKMMGPKIRSKHFLAIFYSAYVKDMTRLIKTQQQVIMDDHILKYDQCVHELLKDPNIKNPIFFLKKKCDNYFAALDSLYQKEKLIGLHKRSSRIIINNRIKQQKLKDSAVNSIDMSQLTMEEKIELNELLEKSRGALTIADIGGYVDNSVVIQDIHHEEMPTIISPMKNITQTNQDKLTPVIPTPQKNMNTVKLSLAERFKQMAEETFKSKGIGKGAIILNDEEKC